MRTYKCCACGAKHDTKTKGLCSACRSIVIRDGTLMVRGTNPEKERRILIYQKKALLCQALTTT